MWRVKYTQVIIFTPLCFLFSLKIEKIVESDLFFSMMSVGMMMVDEVRC